MDRIPRVAIVGAGFCGAVTATHLLRDASLHALRLLLLDAPGRGIGGTAYDVASPRLVLNVPSARMSAFDAEPDDFVAFLRTRDPGAAPDGYARRRDYGEYLSARLEQAARGALERSGGRVTLERMAGHVRDVQRDARGGLVLVVDTADTTREVVADAVLLATGPQAPASPAWLEPWMARAGRYEEAWSPAAASPAGEDTVVLLGTGLTMVDLAGELRARGHEGPIVAISRRGLLPRAERGAVPAPRGDELPPTVRAMLADDPATARRASVALLSRELHRRGREIVAAGGDWRALVGAVRARLPQLWQRLDPRERARFLRHARAYWDVHRHRVPAGLADALEDEARTGRLEILAGRVVSVASADGGLMLRIALRGGGSPRELVAARVVNCTGVGGSVQHVPPWRTLVARGWVALDPLGLGVYTDPDGRLLDATHVPHPDICYAGPLWRAQHWECTAVPELRQRLPRVAAALSGTMHRTCPARTGTLDPLEESGTSTR